MAPNPNGMDGSPSDQPDISALTSDLSGIEAKYAPQIKQERGVAEGFEQKAVAASESSADEAERAAHDATAQDAELKVWADSTPTRQAAYANAMHVAPILSILTALGGKMTKLNGQQMLAATTGIVQGLNAGAEKQYEDAYNAWMASYQKQKEHHDRLMQYHKLMLEAYAGRADAYQRAGEAARRMTGDLLDEKQQDMSNHINTFKAQSQAMSQAGRIKVSLEMLHERTKHDIAQESRWKQIEARAAAADPKIKAQIGAAKQKWTNAKAQIDEYMKQRGQVNSNLSLSEDVKAQMLQQIDGSVSALKLTMDQATSETEALASSVGQGPQPARPGTTLPPENPGRGGTIDRSAQLPPQAVQQLKAHQGTAVTFQNGQTWIMDAGGAVSQVQ